jgi:phage-related protein
MPAIGKGVEEIRVADSTGAHRVIYVARRAEAVYVLHAFKKTQATPRNESSNREEKIQGTVGEQGR